MADKKVEICLMKKKHREHKYSVTFVTKIETKFTSELLKKNSITNGNLTRVKN